MDSFIQQQNRLRQRRKQKGLDFANGAVFGGMISGDHDAETEQLGLSYHGGQRKIGTLHPYVGGDSWIRVGAQSGQQVLAAIRPDSSSPELLAYGGARDPSARVKRYRNGEGVYRPLNPGEIEIHSNGVAQSYYSRRPLLEQRGGLVRSWLDQDRAEAGARAPVHVRHLHLHRGGQVGDEERFGVVTRPANALVGVSKVLNKYVRATRVIDPILATRFAAGAVLAGVVAAPGPWAKEHLRILSSGALFPPKLLDVREGDVIDDTGFPVTLGSSGRPLRYKGEWFCDSPLGGAFSVKIDSAGNFAVATPTEATVGGDIAIPLGDLNVNVGKSHSVQAQTDYTMSSVAGAISMDAQTGFSCTVGGGPVTFNPATTFDIGGADEPAVLGGQLMTMLGQLIDLFASHMHVGNLGAPTPLDPAAVSQVQQIKAQFLTQRAIVSDYVNLSKRP